MSPCVCLPDTCRPWPLPQMAFDLERLQRDLERRGLPTEEIARRLEVATLSQSDPIGILSFSLD